jgi:intracellular sulfur oxidation DsrE/DsrF family protein
MQLRRTFFTRIAAAAAAMAVARTAAAAPASPKNRIVIQVSNSDPKIWNQVLNNLENLQEGFGKDNVQIEVVAYGFGIGMLKLDAVVGGRVTDAVKSGVGLMACEVTMRKQKLTRADMHPGIGYVPGGIIEIVKRQQQGWSYIKG